MNTMLETILIKFSSFIEDVMYRASILIFVLFYTLSYFFKDSTNFLGNAHILMVKDLGKYLANEDSAIITVATVFIGIYFTIYTMLTSIQSDSVLAGLDKKHYKKLLNILGAGFLSSFLYTVYSIFFKISYSETKEWTTFIILLLLISFLTSAFQFGILIFLILKLDISKSIEELKVKKIKEKEHEDLMFELKIFLDKNKEEESKKRSKETDDKIKGNYKK